MISLENGRDHFWQWDSNQRLIIEDASITEVHFCNRTDDCSLVVKTYVENGITLVNVPNILLQTNWRIHVYAVDGNYTKHEKCYEVMTRTKPADYVYTETEIINWQYIKAELDNKANVLDLETVEAALDNKKVDKEDGKGLSAVSDVSILGGGTVGITPPDHWAGIRITKTNGTIENVDFYNKDQMKENLNNKADKATTLDGYGITDAYTKTEVEAYINEAILGGAIENSINEINDKLEYKIDKPTHRVYIGNVEQGKWKQSNGNDYTSSSVAFCLTADVEPNSTYYASGMIVNSSFPLIVMFDSDNNVIGTKESQGNATVKNDVEFVTPYNCTRVSINGRRVISSAEAVYPSLYYIANDNIDGNTIVNSIDEKQNKIIEWKQADYEYVEDTYIQVMGDKKILVINNTTSKGYKYAKLKYDKDKKYRFFGQCIVNYIPTLICCDENDEIIKVYDNTVGIVKAKEYNIPDNVSYIYVNGNAMNPRVEVMEERNVTSFEANKVGVFFGDSITQGNNVYISPSVTPYDDYPSVVGRLLNCTVYNGGIGGSSLSGDRSIDFKNVCDCVISGDFSTVIDGITQYGLNQSAILQYNAISELNFNDVDFVTIAYGTNDWNFGKSIDNVKTSLRYCLDKLLTAYPHLKIYVFTPIYRFNLGDNSEDSDTYVNTTSGLKLHEICTAIIEETKTFNIPCKDMYYEANINKYTKTLYFNGTDGTHPNAKGYALMGEKISKFINSN